MGRDVWFFAHAFACFVVVLVVFAMLIAADNGSGMFDRAWLLALWGGVVLGSVFVARRMWQARGSEDHMKRVEARGLYACCPRS